MTTKINQENADFMASLEVIEGAVNQPYFGIIYGDGGVGKSWLASYAEKPLFLPLESGVNLIKSKKFNVVPNNVDQFFLMVSQAVKVEDIKTVIIDSATPFQQLSYDDVIKRNPSTGGKDPKPVEGIADYGFQNGYAMTMPYWNRLMSGIVRLQSKGLNVILITHRQLKTVRPLTGDSYKAYGFALQSNNNGDACELLRRSCDWCLYMEAQARTTQKAGTFGGTTTIPMAGVRPKVTVYTRANGAFYAKVRAIDEKAVHDSYVINPNDIDGSSRAIFDAITGVGQFD